MAAPQKLPKLPAGVSQACLELVDEPISFHPAVAKLCGSANAGLMCSQGLYWSRMPQVQEKGGWFYKTSAEWQNETCLTRREQETARKILVAKGFMETKLEKVNGAPTLHFRMIWEAILAAHLKAHNVQMDCTNPPNPSHQSDNSDCTNPPNPRTNPPNPIRKQETSHTTTQETSIKPCDSQSSSPGSDSNKEPDPRHQAIVDAIHVCLPKGSKLVMGASDGAAIKRYLRDRGVRTSIDDLRLWIAYRFGSHPRGTNLAEPIRSWIGDIDGFQSGPRNEFGKPERKPSELRPKDTLAWIMRKLAQPIEKQLSLDDPPARISVPSGFQSTAGIQVWSNMLESISRKANRNGNEKWLRPTVGLGIWNGILFVRIPLEEFRAHLAKLKSIFDTEIDGSPIKKIEFLTEEEFSAYPFQEATR